MSRGTDWVRDPLGRLEVRNGATRLQQTVDGSTDKAVSLALPSKLNIWQFLKLQGASASGGHSTII